MLGRIQAGNGSVDKAFAVKFEDRVHISRSPLKPDSVNQRLSSKSPYGEMGSGSPEGAAQ